MAQAGLGQEDVPQGARARSLVQTFAGPEHDARKRVGGDVDGHAGLARDQAVQSAQEGAAAGQHDAAVHDVGGQFGGRVFQRFFDGLDDGIDRVRDGLAHLLRRDDGLAGQARDEVAAPDLHEGLLLQPVSRPDGDLAVLGHAVSDEQVEGRAGVGDDGLVYLVAGDADGARRGHGAEGDDGDLGRPAADVNDHRADRLGHGQARPDGSGHRLLDEIGFFGTGLLGGLDNGPALHLGDARRDADDDDRVEKALAAVDLLDKIAQHTLGLIEVGDDSVF